MSTSCSFRITRTAEDLAQTINALSQRLIKLEQRQEALELQFGQQDSDDHVEELQMLDGVDQILRECNQLLETPTKETNPQESWLGEEHNENMAA